MHCGQIRIGWNRYGKSHLVLTSRLEWRRLFCAQSKCYLLCYFYQSHFPLSMSLFMSYTMCYAFKKGVARWKQLRNVCRGKWARRRRLKPVQFREFGGLHTEYRMDQFAIVNSRRFVKPWPDLFELSDHNALQLLKDWGVSIQFQVLSHFVLAFYCWSPIKYSLWQWLSQI